MKNLENNKNDRIKYINELFSDLKINIYKFLNTGANSEVFPINNEFIFRFPVCKDYKIKQKVI